MGGGGVWWVKNTRPISFGGGAVLAAVRWSPCERTGPIRDEVAAHCENIVVDRFGCPLAFLGVPWRLGCTLANGGAPSTRAPRVVVFETATEGKAGRGAPKYAQQPPVLSRFSGRCSVARFRTHGSWLLRFQNVRRHRRPSLRPLRPWSCRLPRPPIRRCQRARRRPLARASHVKGRFLATSLD